LLGVVVPPLGDPASAPDPGTREFSVVGTSSVRFLAELGAAASSLFAGIAVARTLGASGKGTVSTLTYLVALSAPVMALGLGEAVVRMVGQRRTALEEAVGGVAWVLLRSAPIGGLAVAGCSYPILRVGNVPHPLAVGVTVGATAVAATVAMVYGMVLDAQGRLMLSSAVRLASAVGIGLVTFLLVTVFRYNVLGAVLAALLGTGAAALTLLIITWSSGVRIRAAHSERFISEGLRYARPVFLSSLLVITTARVDLFVVLGLRGAAEAGLYSVALTTSHLTWYAPAALSAAAFPRLAGLGSAEARALVARLVRISALVSAISAVLLALLVPMLLPELYGQGFRAAVTSTLILLLAGFLGAVQWTLSRALSAAGRTRSVPESYLWTLVSMVALDLLLVPQWGLDGAAVAAVAASLCGLWPLMRAFIQEDGATVAALWPRRADMAELRAGLTSMASLLRPRGRKG
jgi:O-antigen/teichoic acid export membrane protein